MDGSAEHDAAQNGHAEPEPGDTRRRKRLWAWLIGILVVALRPVGAPPCTCSPDQRRCPCPPVVGQTVGNATTIVSNAGFTPNVINETSSSPNGTVIAQSPNGGERIDTGSIVTLKVSQGPGRSTSRRCRGCPRAPPTKAIASSGTERRPDGRRESSATIPQGVGDADRAPVARRSMAAAEPVTLYISSGKAPVNVPYLVGLTGGAAAEHAEVPPGLGVTRAQPAANTASQAGTVLSQTPAATKSVPPKGTIVTIVVGTAPTTASVPNVVGLHPERGQRAR